MAAQVNHPFSLATRRLLKWVLARPIRATTGLGVHHAERLPRWREPLILACNHANLADTVVLSSVIQPRFVVAGARPRLFRTARHRAVMSVGNVLMVRSRVQYLADCVHLLQQGEVLLAYPELVRNPDGLGPFRTWPAEVALACRVPILPMYLYGTTTNHRGPWRLHVGTRMAPEGDAETLTERLRAEIERLGS